MRILDPSRIRTPTVLSVNTVESGSKISDEFIRFIDENPTVYHVTDYFAKKLVASGFKRLNERESWNGLIKPGNKYFTTRNDSSIIAFEIGKAWRPGNGIGLVGTHIDNNTMKLKPISKKSHVEGYRLLGVSFYGGPKTFTLLDRDLGIGGRVVVKNSNGVIETKLVHVPYPIARIPSLATHFGAASNPVFDNPETQLVPVIGIVNDGEDDAITEDEAKCPIVDRHDIKLLRTVARSIGTSLSNIIELDLQLFDAQPSTYGGLDKEFVFSSRLDDKLCAFAAMNGLIDSNGSSPNTINVSVAYDNEEIGSKTVAGAQSDLFESTIDRVLGSFPFLDFNNLRRLTFANSIFVSSDVAHAVNPNFVGSYLENHRPKLNVGVVIKNSPSGKYTSEPVIIALIEELARQSGDKLQYFQVRNGASEGSTIGPALSTKTGIRAIDIGIPQLSMHSIRETTGSKDIDLGIRFFKSFYRLWDSVDKQFAHN